MNNSSQSVALATEYRASGLPLALFSRPAEFPHFDLDAALVSGHCGDLWGGIVRGPPGDPSLRDLWLKCHLGLRFHFPTGRSTRSGLVENP